MRTTLALVAIVLTLGAGVPSAPAQMTAHCDQHETGAAHHDTAPTHQHHSSGDTHCPAHQCASTAPCSTISSLLATTVPTPAALIAEVVAVAVPEYRLATHAVPPTPPPPRLALSA